MKSTKSISWKNVMLEAGEALLPHVSDGQYLKLILSKQIASLQGHKTPYGPRAIWNSRWSCEIIENMMDSGDFEWKNITFGMINTLQHDCLDQTGIYNSLSVSVISLSGLMSLKLYALTSSCYKFLYVNIESHKVFWPSHGLLHFEFEGKAR